MTEPVQPTGIGRDAPTETARADFGALLRAARQDAGMDVATLAARLRLHPKQVEALERCDLDALPGQIYVRGFLRGCARELKIDPRPLLDDLDRRAGVEPGSGIPEPSAGSFRLTRFGDGTKPIVTLLLFVLVVAGLVGTLIPRHTPVPPKPPAAPAQEPTTAPGGASPAAPRPPAPPPEGEASAPTSPSPSAAPATGPRAPETPEPAAVSHQPAPVAATPHAVPAAPSSAVPASTAPGKAAGVEHPPAETVHTGDGAELVLRIRAQAWVEVVQSDGTTLLSQNCAPGTVQTIRGKQPLRVVIGNPEGVEAQFRGAAVDLPRYTSPSGVARLTLE